MPSVLEGRMKVDQLKVLIVEDQPNARTTLRHMLSEMGVNQVYEAGDGDEARDLIDTDESMVDLVICDWNMPNFEGIDLLKHLREKNIHTPFLMVTARNDIDSVKDAKEAGVDAYIRKPFSLSDLESKVGKLMQKSGLI